MDKFRTIRNLFPANFHKLLAGAERMADKLQEIRIRVNCPCTFVIQKQELFPDAEGKLHVSPDEGVFMNKDAVESVFNHICNYSPYAFEAQLKQGFITVGGGHRVGVFGQVVMENQQVLLMKQVFFLHIRIVHEVLGVAGEIVPHLFEESFLNTLVISPPGAGKTTMLRDMTRILSDGFASRKGAQICVIDERSEIAGCYMGIPQNKVGMRTDVLDGCPKAIGMSMAIRAMGPEILVVDELGLEEDYKALYYASGCGVGVLASAHGETPAEVIEKSPWNKERFYHVFRRFLLLEWVNGRQVWYLYDSRGRLIKEKESM